MGWLDENSRGRDPKEFGHELGRYLRAARVDKALDGLAGPFGCRRFLVRFSLRGTKVRLDQLQAVPLAWGGGPPPGDPRGERREGLERSLNMLHRNMSTGPAWQRGAVAYLRDAQGRTEIIPVFDEDADVVDFDDLGAPGPPGHPLEDPSYGELLACHEEAIGRIHARTRTHPYEWDWWEIQDDRMLVLHQEENPGAEQKLHCRTLGTFEPRLGRFTWRVDQALFPEAPFAVGAFAATLDAAMELGLLSAARMGAAWLFVQSVDEHNTQLLAVVFER